MAVETVLIKDIIGWIPREYAIPDMQREFVWNNVQVRDFMDSLYRGHPVGMLLVWEVSPEDNIPIRHIDDENHSLREFRHLVIDGQQRLTSLLLIKQGSIFKGKRKREIKLLFNPFTEEFQIDNPKIKNNPEWVNVTEIINSGSILKFIREKIPSLSGDNGHEEQIHDRLTRVKNIFLGEAYSIPIYKISREINYNEITDIFVKLNSKGTKIRITELILALLSLKLPGKFKAGLNKFLDSLSDRGWILDTSVVIRCLVAVAVKGARLKSFRNISDSISERELIKYWDITQESILHCLQILEHNLGIKNSGVLPSQIALVPVVFYLSRQEKLTEKNTKDLILWFILSSYWARYTGPTETRLDQDIRNLNKDNNFSQLFTDLRRQVGRLFVSKSDFVGFKENVKLLSYITLRDGKAEDWFKGNIITTTDYEEHHIFPRSLLFEEGFDYRIIDDVANIAFLSQKANRDISNKEPYEYLSTIDKRKLAKQCVVYEKETLKIKNYEKFLNKRRATLIRKINEYLSNQGLK